MPQDDLDRKEDLPQNEVTADDAKRVFGELLSRVGFGRERIVITRHGKRIAALVSVSDLDLLPASETSEAATTEAAKAGVA